MPLNGHSYLVAQGWTGDGTGLRKGAISRPLAIPQKKTLSGLGKDRDEAFPFWDHLFSVAAKSIQLKCMSDDEDNLPVPKFDRTTTGILSTRRPVIGTPADDSGSSTPDGIQTLRVNLLSVAKREAAKRGLYARFFRGPVLGPDSLDDDEITKGIATEDTIEVIPKKRKGSKAGDEDELNRKRQKKEFKAKQKEELRSKKRRKEAREYVSTDVIACPSKRKRERRRKRESKEVERLHRDQNLVEEKMVNCGGTKNQPLEVPHNTHTAKPPNDQGESPKPKKRKK